MLNMAYFQDAQWGDIDYMYEKQIFTVDKTRYNTLNTFVNSLHNDHMKYIVIVVSISLIISALVSSLRYTLACAYSKYLIISLIPPVEMLNAWLPKECSSKALIRLCKCTV